MYSTRTGLTLGFHGCDKSLVEAVLLKQKSLIKSENPHDWLGHGIYFWENSFSRALEFATQLKDSPRKNTTSRIKNPSVIGAVLNLGHCLDLLDIENLKLLKSGYEMLKSSVDAGLPENKAVKGKSDLLLRNLDCAVVQSLHRLREIEKLPPFDSVRGGFWEGDELYPNAGFKEKNHIQICIINPNCIKGLFLPREKDQHHPTV